MTSGKDLSNLNQIATRTIQWNADNMPTSIIHSIQGTSSFVYDGNNTRVKKVYGGTETYYISPDFEIRNSGTPDYIKYIFAGNLRVASVSSLNGTYYFHKDHLGSSTAMTSSTGSVSETTEYRPFGSQRAHTGSDVSDYKFTDQEMDSESGLYNYDARLCDPVIGRFINSDSIVPNLYDPQFLNRYSYCRNNLLIYVDPTGHICDALADAFGYASGAPNGGGLYGTGGSLTAGSYSPGSTGSLIGAGLRNANKNMIRSSVPLKSKTPPPETRFVFEKTPNILPPNTKIKGMNNLPGQGVRVSKSTSQARGILSSIFSIINNIIKAIGPSGVSAIGIVNPDAIMDSLTGPHVDDVI